VFIYHTLGKLGKTVKTVQMLLFFGQAEVFAKTFSLINKMLRNNELPSIIIVPNNKLTEIVFDYFHRAHY